MEKSVISSVDILSFETVQCTECGCKEFKTVSILKKVPVIYQPMFNQEYCVVQFHKCVECDNIFEEYKDSLSVYQEALNGKVNTPCDTQPLSKLIIT